MNKRNKGRKEGWGRKKSMNVGLMKRMGNSWLDTMQQSYLRKTIFVSYSLGQNLCEMLSGVSSFIFSIVTNIIYPNEVVNYFSVN